MKELLFERKNKLLKEKETILDIIKLENLKLKTVNDDLSECKTMEDKAYVCLLENSNNHVKDSYLNYKNISLTYVTERGVILTVITFEDDRSFKIYNNNLTKLHTDIKKEMKKRILDYIIYEEKEILCNNIFYKICVEENSIVIYDGKNRFEIDMDSDKVEVKIRPHKITH